MVDFHGGLLYSLGLISRGAYFEGDLFPGAYFWGLTSSGAYFQGVAYLQGAHFRRGLVSRGLSLDGLSYFWGDLLLNLFICHVGQFTAMTKANTFQLILNSRPNTQLITFSVKLLDRGWVQIAAVVMRVYVECVVGCQALNRENLASNPLCCCFAAFPFSLSMTP